MVSREFTKDGHTTRVTIIRRVGGWQFVEERDDQRIREVTYHDWHRVERAMQVLQATGTTEQPSR